MKLTLLLLFFFSACAPLRVQTDSAWLRAFIATPTPTATLTATPLPTATPTPQPSPTPVELSFPIRAAYYEPGYPQGWLRADGAPATRYHPDLGTYSLDDPAVIRWHIIAMQYAKIQAGVAAWQGPGDNRIPQLLDAGVQSSFFWALQVPDAPDPAAIQANLSAIQVSYAPSPAYLKLGGRFVVIVKTDSPDCAMADRWVQANTVGAYLALPAFDGFADCSSQPDAWLPVLSTGAPSAATAAGFTIRPGDWPAGVDQPSLARDLLHWAENVRAMVASGAKFQLIASFNNWSAGSAVEDAREWPSASGYGYYLDALHFDGDLAQLFPYRVSLPIVRYDVPVTLVGAGDIVYCRYMDIAWLTSNMLAQFPDAQIFTAGDNVQDNGAAYEYQKCFDPTWGRFKDRLHPAPGNHDIGYDHMNPYYDYFGAIAGERDKGYYSYEVGAWHIIALNSNCQMVGGCEEGSPEEQWLRADLAAHPAQCTLAYWHHPLYGWAVNGPHPEMTAFWRDLYAAGAELVINGHDHNYERFAPQDPDGNVDRQRGIREIVAGTGGAPSDRVTWPLEPNSEVRLLYTKGLLKLDLFSDRYAWQYVPAPGQPGSDSGSDLCH